MLTALTTHQMKKIEELMPDEGGIDVENYFLGSVIISNL